MSSKKTNGNATENGNGVSTASQQQRLRLNANTDHKPDSYDDMVNLGFSPLLFSSLECYLPHPILNFPRDSKINFMRDILTRYSPEGDRTRIQKHKEYRERIVSNYQPFVTLQTEYSSRDTLHRELFTMHPLNFFGPSFLEAIKENTEVSFRHIMAEPVLGVFVFEMLQPSFCEMSMAEVEHFEKWVHNTRFRIMRPNTMNKYGAVLDYFGLEKMLDKLMNDFIRPLSGVFFHEVGGLTLDSHHGFVVDMETKGMLNWVGFHVDNAEVSLNVCLGKQFYGGELFFRGVRCDKHVDTESQPEEILNYIHVPGRAVLHRGRHRHGARATTSGNRSNLILWCRSSVFRELKKYQKDFSSWCGECLRVKKERQRMSIAATKMELLKRDGISAS